MSYVGDENAKQRAAIEPLLSCWVGRRKKEKRGGKKKKRWMPAAHFYYNDLSRGVGLVLFSARKYPRSLGTLASLFILTDAWLTWGSGGKLIPKMFFHDSVTLYYLGRPRGVMSGQLMSNRGQITFVLNHTHTQSLGCIVNKKVLFALDIDGVLRENIAGKFTPTVPVRSVCLDLANGIVKTASAWKTQVQNSEMCPVSMSPLRVRYSSVLFLFQLASRL